MNLVIVASLIALLALVQQYSIEKMKDNNYTRFILSHKAIIANYQINYMNSVFNIYIVCQLALLVMLSTSYFDGNKINNISQISLHIIFIVVIVPAILIFYTQNCEIKLKKEIHPIIRNKIKKDKGNYWIPIVTLVIGAVQAMFYQFFLEESIKENETNVNFKLSEFLILIAIVIIPIVVIFFVFKGYKKRKEEEAAKQNEIIINPSSKIDIHLNNGEIRKLDLYNEILVINATMDFLICEANNVQKTEQFIRNADVESIHIVKGKNVEIINDFEKYIN